MSNKELVILFGSRVKGTAGKMSDTDIAVLDDHELELLEKGDIAEKMAARLGVSEDEVDVVDLRVASPLLQYEVAKRGKLLSGSEHDFFRFRVLAWKRYQDTTKFRKRREEVLREYFDAPRN